MRTLVQLRRGVGALLIGTMAPWFTGCYNRVRFAPATSQPATGKRVHVACSSPASANVILQDGNRLVLEHVVEAEGTLAMAGADSVRLTNVLVKLADRSQSHYREAALAASPEMRTETIQLDLVRTVAFVVGTGLVTLAVLAAILFADMDLYPSVRAPAIR